MKKVFAIAGVVAMMASGSALAGDAAAGKAKAAVCAACHGANGISASAVPMYPNLKGQKAQYLENALKAYKNGQRTGGTAAMMAPQAAGLSDADIANLAAYFSSL